MLKVTLLQHTPEPEKIISAAAKLCYSSSGISDIMDKLDDVATEKFLNMLVDMGHESPIEHVTFTFGIEGVSRSLLAQLTRHRIASYSVKSQRYVTEGCFGYVVPPEINACKEARELFVHTMQQDQKSYDRLLDVLFEKHYKSFLESGKNEKTAKSMAEKKAAEDARYVLPNACETSLIATFNARSLYNFFKHRLCERAQWEIRDMADQMASLVLDVAPTLFKRVGPPCVFGICPEGKMSCGKAAEKKKKYGRV